MKSTLKLCLKAGIMLIGGIGLGSLLLILVYMLPLNPIREHVSQSVKVLDTEGENPYLIEGYKGSSLDNHTDALMLANASYRSDEPFYKAAMLVERRTEDTDEDEPIECLKHDMADEPETEVTSYGRYWHGYLVLLKPLLCVMNYQQIRMLNTVIYIILLLVVLAGFWKRKMWRGALAFLLALSVMFPGSVMKSMQFSTCYYVGTIVCLVILAGYDRLREKERLVYVFLVAGMATSYVDFLTYPVYTVGMPLVLVCVLEEKPWSKRLLSLVKYGAAWAVGYAGMWAGKWLVGSLITGRSILSDAVNMVNYRVTGDVTGENINGIMAVLRNGYVLANLRGVIVILLLMFGIIISLKKYKSKEKAPCCLLVLLSCMPVAWYLVIANHSYVHYWYTFRGLAVFVFALGMIPEMLYRSGETEERS